MNIAKNNIKVNLTRSSQQWPRIGFTFIETTMVIYRPLWKVKSKGAVFALFQDFVVFTTTLITLQPFYQLAVHKADTSLIKLWYTGVVVVAALVAITFPVAGWLADVYHGRYKVRRIGLWLMWTGELCVVTTYLLLTDADSIFKGFTEYMLFGTGILGFGLVSTGFAAYAVNAVQFGIDQMPDASSEELCAYIHWVACLTFIAGTPAVLNYLTHFCHRYWYNIFQLMVPMTMLSLGLCCEFLLRGWLIIEPGSRNSLRMIYRVLKFAATNKYPIRRHAITYTEDEKPSRIDFAKDKYGGPFTTEQVEDVKTFFRIVIVLVSTITVLIPLLILAMETGVLLKPVYPCNSPWYSKGDVAKRLACSMPTLAIEIIVLYSFIIHPLCKKKMLTMLQRVVIAAFLTVVLSAAILLVEMLEPNLFGVCGFNHTFVSVNYTVVALYNVIIAIVVVLFFIANLEFICAQSPYHLHGLLFGLMYFIVFITLFIVCGILTAWEKVQMRSCDSYYFLFQFLCAVVGLIVLCIVARWYKRRRREEEDDQRRIVEEIYDRMLQNQSRAN